MMDAASSSETSVNVYQTTQHNIPEDSHLQAETLSNVTYAVFINESGL
jgi:hypothetical protein